MRALIQRVKQCRVLVEGKSVASAGAGLLILLGVKTDDGDEDAKYLAARCAALRVFDDAEGKMNLSLRDVRGEAVVVSQFTLYGDTRKGNRPSYTDAAPPALAERLYEAFVASLRNDLGDARVQTGVFRALMDVHLVNDGPVTVMVESKPPASASSNR
ncbi:MAG: D-tyrosyl-tRNA(Tyr) deacylase [Ignavibacteriales bacterium]|nr:D-tyrosyl-tRNA(Tyr) deacylase [Ignavibacteriales bacterium]